MSTNNTATWTTDPSLTPWLAAQPACRAPGQASTPLNALATTPGPEQGRFDLGDTDLDDAELWDELDDGVAASPVPMGLPAPRPTPRPRPLRPARVDAQVMTPDQDPAADLAVATASGPAEPPAAPAPPAIPTEATSGPRPVASPGTPTASPALTDLVRTRKARPNQGWRGAAYVLSRGAWNPGLSPVEAEHRRLITQARTHLAGWHTVTVSNMKGGIGKTTVAAGLGLTLAEHRGDRIVALDANPDAGTLADRLSGHCGVTVRELINNLDTIKSLVDIAHFTSLAGRLQVLASEQDPAMSEAFSRDEYEAVCEVLTRFYNVIITDSGTGLVHSAMGGALDGTKTLVIAAAPTVDGASRSSKTLDWLIAHGYRELVDRAVVALSCDRSSRDVDREAIVNHFRARCRAVVEIPADPHLAIGGMINLDELHPRTRDAFLRLAAAVAEQFSWDSPQPRGVR
jgi:MinD-like ATPase involved in chromosome partitioning or flagellar assembly